MPAKSRKQQQMMAIAEHEPNKLYKKNKGVLGMSQGQLHDFAATKGASKKKKATLATTTFSATGHAYDFRKQTGPRAPVRMTKMVK
jgi:hypothetical protein